MEKAAIAKQMKVKNKALSLPDSLSSVSANAAAIIPRMSGVIAVFCSRYQQGITAPTRASNTLIL
ncbi:hypothetical protein GCM10007987_28230 [Aliivibrio fischeri]|nr:hypothetical protein GCM10007987_28230 [Aliivibrio fischeri]